MQSFDCALGTRCSEVASLGIGSAAQLEAEIRKRLASSSVPAEVQDIEVEKVVRQIEAHRP